MKIKKMSIHHRPSYIRNNKTDHIPLQVLKMLKKMSKVMAVIFAISLTSHAFNKVVEHKITQ